MLVAAVQLKIMAVLTAVQAVQVAVVQEFILVLVDQERQTQVVAVVLMVRAAAAVQAVQA
jgi:hypothetical protein